MVDRDVYDDVQKIFMRWDFMFWILECKKETEWHNIGMLMNMQANALKVQDYINKYKIHAYQYHIFPRIHPILEGSFPFPIEVHFPLA